MGLQTCVDMDFQSSSAILLGFELLKPSKSWHKAYMNAAAAAMLIPDDLYETKFHISWQSLSFLLLWRIPHIGGLSVFHSLCKLSNATIIYTILW